MIHREVRRIWRKWESTHIYVNLTSVIGYITVMKQQAGKLYRYTYPDMLQHRLLELNTYFVGVPIWRQAHIYIAIQSSSKNILVTTHIDLSDASKYCKNVNSD